VITIELKDFNLGASHPKIVEYVRLRIRKHVEGGHTVLVGRENSLFSGEQIRQMAMGTDERKVRFPVDF